MHLLYIYKTHLFICWVNSKMIQLFEKLISSSNLQMTQKQSKIVDANNNIRIKYMNSLFGKLNV